MPRGNLCSLPAPELRHNPKTRDDSGIGDLVWDFGGGDALSDMDDARRTRTIFPTKVTDYRHREQRNSKLNLAMLMMMSHDTTKI